MNLLIYANNIYYLLAKLTMSYLVSISISGIKGTIRI